MYARSDEIEGMINVRSHVAGILMLRAAAAASVISVAAGCAASRPAPALAPYITCNFEDGLAVANIDRRTPGLRQYRTVRTATGEKDVSSVDGYRLMLRYRDADYDFANLKVEQSDPAAYATDKQVLLEHLRYLAERDKATLISNSYDGFEGHAVQSSGIDGGIVAMQVLFSDADHMIVTVDFLSQGPTHRRFNNIDEFNGLKEEFFKLYVGCVHRNSVN
jgi:hypothetical protein